MNYVFEIEKKREEFKAKSVLKKTSFGNDENAASFDMPTKKTEGFVIPHLSPPNEVANVKPILVKREEEEYRDDVMSTITDGKLQSLEFVKEIEKLPLVDSSMFACQHCKQVTKLNHCKPKSKSLPVSLKTNTSENLISACLQALFLNPRAIKFSENDCNGNLFNIGVPWFLFYTSMNKYMTDLKECNNVSNTLTQMSISAIGIGILPLTVF